MKKLDQLYRTFTLAEAYQETPSSIGDLGLSQQSHKFWHNASVSEFLFQAGLKPEYPHGKTFAACISHDIDLLYNHNSIQGNLYWGAKRMLQGKFSEASYHLHSIRNKRINPSWKLSHTLEILEKFEITSSFYFLALEEGEQDFNYPLHRVADEIKRLENQGHEVGLHGGHEAFDKREKLAQEKNKVQQYSSQEIQGYRNHYLHLEIPQTWKILEELGFSYDHTLGFSREIGFRNGMCYPFRPYLASENRWLDIFVLPLTIMDVAVFLRKDFSYNQSLTLCKKIIDEVAQWKGFCSILWHNNYMQGEMGQFFEDLLSYLKSKNAWMPSSAEYLDWWKQNNFDKQVEDILEQQLLRPNHG